MTADPAAGRAPTALPDLHDRGVISDAEFKRGKEKILQ
jgi:hypothetical protein